MSIKIRLILMNFMQYFIWGSWLLTIGAYCSQNKHWSFSEFGAIFSTMGISAIFMPALTGIIVDRWINAERLYGIMHILGALSLLALPMVNNPSAFFWIMLLNMAFYMPTISLIHNSCLFSNEKKQHGCGKRVPSNKHVGNCRLYCCACGR